MDGNLTLTASGLTDIADSLRLGLEAEANEQLAQQYEILARNLAVIPSHEQAGFTTLLQTILAAQARQDVIGLADLLEYELLPQLRILQILAENAQ